MAIKYVATTGNNASDGSIDAPWATIAYGVAHVASGDVLTIRGGTYTSNLIDSEAGTVQSNIIVIAAVGETVVLQPSGGNNHAIRLTTGAPHHIRFKDLILDGINNTVIAPSGGNDLVYLAGGAHHNQFVDLEVKRNASNGYGLSTNGGSADYNEIIGGVIHDNGRLDFGNTGYAVYVKTSYTLISGVEMYGNNGYGIHQNAPTSGNYNRYVGNNIHDNAVHGVPTAGGVTSFGIVLIGGTGNLIANNLIYANYGGVLIYNDTSQAQVVNNTITGNSPGIGIMMQYYGTGNVVANNIVYDNATDVMDYGGSGVVSLDSNLIAVDPLFTDAPSFDFTVQEGSPAIDAGITSSHVPVDYTGGGRGTTPDIGAYEVGAEPLVIVDPDAPGTTTIYTYSDHDMQCPGDWENGFKEARVMHFGDGERTLSHSRSGDWQGSTFTLEISDYDRLFRERLDSETFRYWNEAWTVKMTDRPTRAAKGVPYTVFVGPVIDAKTTGPQSMAWDITLGDVVSRGLLSDQAQAPWRRIGDGFLSQFAKVADGLDPNTPEPIIYGIHSRLPDDPTSGSAGIVYKPTYLGIMSDASDQHVWMVAGHACVESLAQYVDYVASGEFTFTNSIDYRSDTFGNLRRYALVTADVTDPGFLDPDVPINEDTLTDADACALGRKTLTVHVSGIEPNGDGSGTVITDRILQYKHFAVNFIANQGQDSYQSGDWLETPNWSVFGVAVPIIDEAAFDAAQAISLIRFPVDGYTGAGIIGATAGERRPLREWIAQWNRSCSVRFGISHLGQVRIFMLHPTQAIKDAAPLLDDVNAILRDSFKPFIRWDEHANRIPIIYDKNLATGEYLGTSTIDDGISISGYGRVITSETIDFPFAPGIVNAEHLGTIYVRTVRFPPRAVTLQTPLTPLGTMDLGQYVRYRHFASIGASASEIRLGWIERHQVQAGKRLVEADLLDVEDLIDFDLNEPPSAVSPLNDTCANAIDITPDLVAVDGQYHYTGTFNTTDHATDHTFEDVVDIRLPDPHVAYHAFWLKLTAPEDGNFALTTITSAYDTALVYLTGTCGSSPMDWTVDNFNDNDIPLHTSAANVDLIGGQTVYILIYGVGADDAGTLVLTGTHAPPA